MAHEHGGQRAGQCVVVAEEPFKERVATTVFEVLFADVAHTWRSRAVAVVIASAYTFFLARTAGAIVLLPAPVFPFTAIGIADHLAERRWDREVAARES